MRVGYSMMAAKPEHYQMLLAAPDFCKAEVVEKTLRQLRGSGRERGMMLDTRITHYGFMHGCTCVGAEG